MKSNSSTKAVQPEADLQELDEKTASARIESATPLSSTETSSKNFEIIQRGVSMPRKDSPAEAPAGSIAEPLELRPAEEALTLVPAGGSTEQEPPDSDSETGGPLELHERYRPETEPTPAEVKPVPSPTKDSAPRSHSLLFGALLLAFMSVLVGAIFIVSPQFGRLALLLSAVCLMLWVIVRSQPR